MRLPESVIARNPAKPGDEAIPNESLRTPRPITPLSRRRSDPVRKRAQNAAHAHCDVACLARGGLLGQHVVALLHPLAIASHQCPVGFEHDTRVGIRAEALHR